MYLRELKIFTALSIVVFLGGCELGKVESIKGGFLSGYDSLTVGDAFDGWSACSSSDWTAFDTDRNEQTVEYSCVIPDFNDARNQLRDAVIAKVAEDKDGFDKQVNDQLAAQAFGQQISGDSTLLQRLQSGERFSSERYLQLLNRIKELNYVVQFTLSKKDDSFDVSWWGLRFVYLDGTSESGAIPGDTVETILNTVYQNVDPELGKNAAAIDNVLTSLSIAMP